MSSPDPVRAARAPLPIDAMLPSIVEALRDRKAAVVEAAPGAGKTTRVPPALLESGLAGASRIVMLEPRRVAARAAARRIAEENGWRLGDEVGYRIRFQARDSPATRILVVTEGVLLRMLQSDPLLDGVAVVIFDEFHERRLDADLALAMTRRVAREVRPDLRILVMSATLESAPIAAFLGTPDDPAPVLESAGRAHPVRIDHVPRAAGSDPLAGIRAGVAKALDEQVGDVLTFLPGVGEIKRATKRLAAIAAARDLEIVPLYGDLDSGQQDRALRRGPKRRIVLATNVAETSVTVDGVDAVVDSGLARVLRYDPASGLDRLELRPIARASADQRAGRAGRLGPGLAIRLWSAHEDRGLREQEAPEIGRVDLAGAVLQLLAWGEPDVAAFPWFEAPGPEAIARARALLVGLGAIDGRGVNPSGRAMARLGLHPRLARLLIAGRDAGRSVATARIAALLSERDIVERVTSGSGPPPVVDAESDSDVLDRLAALDDFARHGWGETPAGPLVRGRARHVLRVADHLARRAKAVLGPPGTSPDTTGGRVGSGRDALLRAILAAYPDRVARRRGDRDPRAVMVDGRGVQVASRSAVRAAKLFVCVEIKASHGGQRKEALAFQASAIDESWLDSIGQGIVAVDDVVFDFDRQRVVGRRQRRFGDLVLDERERPAGAEEAAACLARAAAEDLDAALPLDDDSVAQFRWRVARLRAWLPDADLPALDEDALRGLLPTLTPGRRSFSELRRAPLLECLRGLLDHRALSLVEREAPDRVTLPSGRSRRLRYTEDGPPVLAVRIQDLFGVLETPTVARGRVPVLLHLLAPNQRPQQVTQDLASFWRNTYPEVRKELAGRYPKHAWPSDPRTAAPPRRPGTKSKAGRKR